MESNQYNCKECDCYLPVTNPLRKGICANCTSGNHKLFPKEESKTNSIGVSNDAS